MHQPLSVRWLAVATVLGLAVGLTPVVQANLAEVETSVNVSVETGDATPGQVVTGDESVQVKVETVVNGSVVEPINLNVPTGAGSTSLRVEQSASASSDAPPQTETEVTVNGQPVMTAAAVEPTPDAEEQPPIEQSQSSLFTTFISWLKQLWHNLVEHSA